MKKIAIISRKNSKRVEFIKGILSHVYEINEVNTLENTYALLESQFRALCLVIIDNPSKVESTKEVLGAISKKSNFVFYLPVLILTDPENMERDSEYLDEPVVGVISSCDNEKIILKRVEHAIKLANSASFDDFSEMLKALPSLIYLKDKAGLYAFSSQSWHHLKDGESIRGKTDFEIRKDKKNAEIARAKDLEVLKTGKGQRYVIKECTDEGTDYLQVIKEPLKDENGEVNGIIAIVNNVTDEEILRQELREKSITDQLTGLYNRYYFEEISASHRDNITLPLTVISADCDGLKQINDSFGHSAGDQYILYARDAIQTIIPEGSYLFRMGGDEFLAILPGVSKEGAQAYIERINENVKNYKNDDFALKLSVGGYTITNKNINVEKAYIYSDKAMYEAKRRHKKDC